MKRYISYILIIFLLASNVTFIRSANAAKIGVTCNKVNAKSWSGNTPIICKKNSKGKLVWTKFAIAPVQKQASFEDFCALMKKAAFAHLEFNRNFFWNDDSNGTNQEKYYLRVQSYMIKAGTLLRTMKGNNNSLIADAQDASTNAYGFNGTWNGSEGRLYAACGISKDSVTKSYDKMMGF
jgi:hypothetical protein